LRISILAAEIIASRRLLSQLNPETTRVGVITFDEDARVRQPLTRDFEPVRTALDLIYKRGPYVSTNMVEGIRLATEELLGTGESEKRLDATKTVLFLTDGFPTLPSRDCTSGVQANADLAINAARLAGKTGINVHVFALGEKALSHPRAAVGIAKESGGTYTPVSRPANVLAVLDRVSVVGVDFIQVTNETIGQRALQSRLVADGFFASAVPVVEGLNRIQVVARASDGSIGRDTITVHYQPGGMRSLDLEVFLEREKSLKLEVERLGKSAEQIQRDVERNKEESLRQSPTPPTSTVRFLDSGVFMTWQTVMRRCLAFLVGAFLAANASGQTARPELIGFKSGDLELRGFIWKPTGEGPFPALLWNHGSGKSPGSIDTVAPYFVSKGYVFFVPHRRGQGRSPGPYIMDELNMAGSRLSGERGRREIELHETHLEDQLAALQYLQALPYVHKNRIAVMGASFGGIQTMLAVERGASYRVAVNCSGAAESWRGSSALRSRLIAAASKATMPVFFLQAENDHDLTPNRVLNEEVRKSGQLVQAKVYPAFGSGPREGHSFCSRGTEIWGPDVLKFIETHLK
jgi:carboxymethylenebutenolidase